MRSLLVVLVLAGCGPGVDFAGTYRGELTEVWACTPVYASNNGTRSTPWQIRLVQDSAGLRMEPGLSCASLSLEVRGATATFKPVKCPGDGMLVVPTDVLSGGLVLQPGGERLTVKLEERLPAERGSCDVSVSGSLPKL